jgi:CubicO group peptidase (beta-lactamase class C family)
MWRTFAGPDRSALVASLKDSEPTSSPGSRWNYSNLGYALLGEVIARTTGNDARVVVDERLLRPLGLARTSWDAAPPAAPGQRVDPYADALHAEPDMDQGSIGVGGQLWSTTGDLLTWSQALLGGRPDVLPSQVADAMHTLHTMVDPERWDEGWGLGLRLVRHGDRILAGHTGVMPGFTSSLLQHRPTGVSAVVLVNATRAESVDELARALVDRAVEHVGTGKAGPWEPGPSCPPEVEAILGPWWSESDEIVLTWAGDRLRVQRRRAPGEMSIFDCERPDVFRVSVGRWHGERLVVERDEHGRPDRLEWATYPFTRRPR